MAKVRPSKFNSKLSITKVVRAVHYRPEIPDGFVLVVDTREQLPYKPSGIKLVYEKLDAGDYSIKGFESMVSIERKSQADFYSSITDGRGRLKAMFKRMKDMEFRGLLIECSEEMLMTPGMTYSGVHPNSVYGSIVAFEVKYGIHVYYGNRKGCEAKLLSWLSYYYRVKRRV